MRTLISLVKDESGATAIEYGLIAALISIVAIVAMQKVGQNLGATFNSVSSNLTTAR
jgi:pilus assembly protein Flp/PilA